MVRLIFAFVAVLAAFTVALPAAKAQSGDTPQQLQAMIVNGQAQTAIGELHTILQAHPTSGVAWYLTAEAQDVVGNESAARSALNNAEQFAPGLPFANKNDVAALQAHLAGGQPVAVAHHSGISPMLTGIIILVILFMVFRMFARRRRMMAPGYQNGFGQAGPGPYPYNQGPGMGGGGMGIGGSLLGGLAAGAGFAAGERVIDDMMGGNNNQVDQAWGNQPQANPDDGLQGSPGWDSGSAPDDSNFDPNNSW